MLLLLPPAARNAIALLNCAPTILSPAGCASLNGCSSNGGGSRGSTVSVSLLVSNPYYVCWATGGAHNAAGLIAVMVLVVVVASFPIAFLWAVYRLQRAGKLVKPGLLGNLVDNKEESSDQPAASGQCSCDSCRGG